MDSLYWPLKSGVMDMATRKLQDPAFHSPRGMCTWINTQKWACWPYEGSSLNILKWSHYFPTVTTLFYVLQFSYIFSRIVSFNVAVTKCQLKNPGIRFNLAHGFRVISPLWWRWHGRTRNIGSREAGRGVPGGTRHILENGPTDLLRSHLPTQWHQQGTNPSTWGLWGDTLSPVISSSQNN